MRPFLNMSSHRPVHTLLFIGFHVADAGASSRHGRQQQSRKNPGTSIIEMEKRTRDSHSASFTMFLVILLLLDAIVFA
jgi:hypothetical protein